MNVGYARVSTSSQSLKNQIEQLKAVGFETFSKFQTNLLNYDITLITIAY